MDIATTRSKAVERTDLLVAIKNRCSATRLVDPGPTPNEIEEILLAGARAPDHGRLRPWRFLVLTGEARIRLGDLLSRALSARTPDAPEIILKREREKPLRAPAIIVAAAAVNATHPKIPVIEQIVAVGAAVENMILAAQALGYGSMWRTGAPAYDAIVKQGLGLKESDQIVAFLYLGTVQSTLGPRAAVLQDLVRYEF